MGINKYNLKRWFEMIFNRGVFYVNQPLGLFKNELRLNYYYNDLSEKVHRGYNNLDENNIPIFTTIDKKLVHMPIMIFQYGLGAFDLWLKTKDINYLNKAILCSNWAIKNQKSDGSWDCFSYIYPNYPNSSMAQGQAISLLLRVSTVNYSVEYINAAHKSMLFLSKDIRDGGTTLYQDDQVFFMEYTNFPVVLNGWIFTLFGIHDYNIFFNNPMYKDLFNKSINTLSLYLHKFDTGFWSKYDSNSIISSPFYHKLHIDLLKALYLISNINVFNKYSEKFMVYYKNTFYKIYAILIKITQKILFNR
jgi:hypothetical protein